MAGGPGPVALVGSGEFLPGMAAVDGALLEGRPRRAVVLPTAAAPEGDERVAYWISLARSHYEAMGVEVVPLDVRTRADAFDPAPAGAVDGAGLVYLSGGNPHHLARTLESTPVWDAIRTAWKEGAAVGGCSAGAMALTSGAPLDLFASGDEWGELTTQWRAANGLGLVSSLAVIPHFDWMQRVRPGVLARFAAWHPPGTTLVGIEEDTALVTDAGGWRVQGRGAVWVFEGDDRTAYRDGDDVALPGRAGDTSPGPTPTPRNVATANTVGQSRE